MRAVIVGLMLALNLTMPTETRDNVYIPNAYEVECFTDGCLGDLIQPAGSYDGQPY